MFMKNFYNLRRATISLLIFLIIGALEVVKTQAFEQDAKFHSVVTIGGASRQVANTITSDANGNNIVSGVFDSGTDFDPGQSSVIFSPFGLQDGFIAKYSSSSELVWAKHLRSTTSNSSITLRKHAIDNNGNIVIIGDFKGTFDFDPSSNNNLLTANVQLAGFYAKYSSAGELVFAKKFDTLSNFDATCHVNDLYIDPVGKIYMTGSSTGPIDLDAGPQALTKIPRVWDDLWFELVDQNGDLVSATILMGSDSSFGTSITVDESNNIYVGVKFTGIFDADPSANATLLTSLIGKDAALLKFSNPSTLDYAKQFECGLGNVSISQILAIKNSSNVTSIFVGGSFTNTFDLDPDNGSQIMTSQGLSDLFIGKFLASNGTYQSGFSIGGLGNDYCNDIEYDTWQHSVIVGGNFSNTVDFDNNSNASFNFTSNGGLDNFLGSYKTSDLSFNFAKHTGGTGKEVLTSVSYNSTSKRISYAGSFENTVDFDPSDVATLSRTSTGFDNYWLSGLDHYIMAAVEIDSIWGIRPTSVGVSAKVNNDGNNAVTERGFVYGLVPNNLTVLTGDSVRVGSGVGSFSKTINNLTHNKKYYVKAFAKNDLGFVYSALDSFTTLTPFDTLTSFTAVIPDSNRTVVRLNWTLPTNKVQSTHFVIVRKDFGIYGTDTSSSFKLLGIVPRNSELSNYVYTDNTGKPHRSYEYDVVPTAILIIGELPKELVDKILSEAAKIMRVIPSVPTVGTMNEVRDSIRNINVSWVISYLDSTTNKIYVEYGSGLTPSTYSVIDSISRLTLESGGVHKVKRINGQRIQNGIHTFRLRAATSFEAFPSSDAVSITLKMDTLKYTSSPIMSSCKDSVYNYAPTLKSTTVGSVLHSIINPPTGVSFNIMNGSINWTPTSNGSYNFKTVVTSLYNVALKDTQQFTVKIKNCKPPNYYNQKCSYVSGGVIEANNANIVNAKITAFRTDQQIAQDMIMSYQATIVNNAYTLHLPAGNYKLQFSGANYITTWFSNATNLSDAQVVTTTCDENLVSDFNNITITTGTVADMTFSGKITSSTNGANLVASIRFIPVNSSGQVTGDTVQEVTSTTDGSYSAKIRDNQLYHVFCSSTGFNSQYFDKAPSILQATIVNKNTANKNTVNFSLFPLQTTLYSINGILQNAEGLSLEGIIIAHRIKDENETILTTPEIFSTETIVSNQNGTWNLTNIKQGTYVILIIPKTKDYIPGYVNIGATLSPRKWQDATTFPITTQLTTPIGNIRLESTKGVKGINSWSGYIFSEGAGLKSGVKRVEQPSSTITEPGVIIMLNDNNGEVVDYSISSNDGFVLLENLELGLFEYETSKVGFLPGNGQITVVESDDSTGNVVVERDPSYIPPSSVLDSYSNNFSFVTPNPVSSVYRISLQGTEGDVEVTIVDYLGRIRYLNHYVVSGNTFEASFSANDLEQGSYKVLVRSGRRTAVSSMIIAR